MRGVINTFATATTSLYHEFRKMNRIWKETFPQSSWNSFEADSIRLITPSSNYFRVFLNRGGDDNDDRITKREMRNNSRQRAEKSKINYKNRHHHQPLVGIEPIPILLFWEILPQSFCSIGLPSSTWTKWIPLNLKSRHSAETQRFQSRPNHIFRDDSSPFCVTCQHFLFIFFIIQLTTVRNVRYT